MDYRDKIEKIICRVRAPARYAGGEWNAVVKDGSGVKLRVALAFPDVYEVGMSYLGFQILYGIVNGLQGFAAERAFCPWPDMAEELRREKLPLFSLESRRPLKEFDVVGFSLQYEMTYTNVLLMLELAQVKKTDLVYDLGCGDGRIVVTAAKKYGCRAVGYDIDPQAVRDARKNVEDNNVGDLVRIEQADIFTLDLSDADVITLYLLPELNVKLIPQLEKLKPGSRIVSHNFDMKGVIPDKLAIIKGDVIDQNDPRADSKVGEKLDRHVFLWTTPLKKENP